MKKFLSALIVCAMLLSLCACSSDAPPAAEAPIQSSAPTSAPAEPFPVESPQPSQTPEVRLPEGCRLYYELFTFSAEGVTGNIEHNAMNGRWKISTSADIFENMEATEADGILSLSDGSSVWKFHRQGDDLVYDGGENASAAPELQPGQLIERSDASYLYHMVPYILDLSAIEAREDVSGLEAARARLIFDTENKRFVLYDEFGSKQEGVFNCDGQRIRLHYGQKELTARIMLERRYELFDIQGRVNELIKPPYLDIFKQKSLSYKAKTLIKILCPPLHRYYRKKQGYGD